MITRIKTRFIGIVFTAFVLLAAACSGNNNESVAVDADRVVRLGLAMQPTSALAIIAHSRGYFKKQGVNVEVVPYLSGKRALWQGLLKGKVDLVTTAETPFALAAFESPGIKVLGTIFYSDNVNRIVTRRDHKVVLPADLKGKIIATQKASAVDYFLYQFLLENSINPDQVTIRYMKAEQLVPALVKGEIDAFSMRDPFVSDFQNQMPDQSLAFEEPGIYTQIGLLVGSESFLYQNPVLAQRIVSALKLAEQYCLSHKQRAIELVASYIAAEPASLAAAWKDSEIRMQLGQAYININEDIARWAIKRNLVKSDRVPDFLRLIYAGPMLAVTPDSVNITVE